MLADPRQWRTPPFDSECFCVLPVASRQRGGLARLHSVCSTWLLHPSWIKLDPLLRWPACCCHCYCFTAAHARPRASRAHSALNTASSTARHGAAPSMPMRLAFCSCAQARPARSTVGPQGPHRARACCTLARRPRPYAHKRRPPRAARSPASGPPPQGPRAPTPPRAARWPAAPATAGPPCRPAHAARHPARHPPARAPARHHHQALPARPHPRPGQPRHHPQRHPPHPHHRPTAAHWAARRCQAPPAARQRQQQRARPRPAGACRRAACSPGRSAARGRPWAAAARTCPRCALAGPCARRAARRAHVSLTRARARRCGCVRQGVGVQGAGAPPARHARLPPGPLPRHQAAGLRPHERVRAAGRAAAHGAQRVRIAVGEDGRARACGVWVRVCVCDTLGACVCRVGACAWNASVRAWAHQGNRSRGAHWGTGGSAWAHARHTPWLPAAGAHVRARAQSVPPDTPVPVHVHVHARAPVAKAVMTSLGPTRQQPFLWSVLRTSISLCAPGPARGLVTPKEGPGTQGKRQKGAVGQGRTVLWAPLALVLNTDTTGEVLGCAAGTNSTHSGTASAPHTHTQTRTLALGVPHSAARTVRACVQAHEARQAHKRTPLQLQLDQVQRGARVLHAVVRAVLDGAAEPALAQHAQRALGGRAARVRVQQRGVQHPGRGGGAMMVVMSCARP